MKDFIYGMMQGGVTFLIIILFTYGINKLIKKYKPNEDLHN